MGPGGYFPGEIQAEGRGRGICEAGSGPRVRLPDSLSWSSVGSGPAVNCRAAAAPE